MGFHRRSAVLWGGVTKSNFILPARITNNPEGGQLRSITYDEEY